MCATAGLMLIWPLQIASDILYITAADNGCHLPVIYGGLFYYTVTGGPGYNGGQAVIYECDWGGGANHESRRVLKGELRTEVKERRGE